MAKRLLLIAWIALAGCGVATPAARAKGVGMMASPEGVIAGANPYRYVALFPNYQARFPKGAEKLTVPRVLFRTPGRLSELAWSPDGERLLIAWPDADQWLFVPADGSGRVQAIGDVAAQFAPGGRAAAFPQIEGWCCALTVGGAD
jgi:hypothetical protein